MPPSQPPFSLSDFEVFPTSQFDGKSNDFLPLIYRQGSSSRQMGPLPLRFHNSPLLLPLPTIPSLYTHTHTHTHCTQTHTHTHILTVFPHSCSKLQVFFPMYNLIHLFLKQTLMKYLLVSRGFPGGTSGKDSTCQYR